MSSFPLFQEIIGQKNTVSTQFFSPPVPFTHYSLIAHTSHIICRVKNMLFYTVRGVVTPSVPALAADFLLCGSSFSVGDVKFFAVFFFSTETCKMKAASPRWRDRISAKNGGVETWF